MATIYTGINDPIAPFQARIFADGIDVHDSVFVDPEFTPPHILRPCTIFQWYKDDEVIFGATNDTYTVQTNNIINSGTYYCIITIGDPGDGEFPETCITERTDDRIVIIIRCGAATHLAAASGGIFNATIDYPEFVGDLGSDALSSDVPWTTTGAPTTVTVAGIKTTTFPLTIASTIASRSGFVNVLLGDFTCIYGITQRFAAMIPPVQLAPATPGPAIFDIFNDGPSAASANCVVYSVAIPPGIVGTYSINFVTCTGESSYIAFSSTGGPNFIPVEITAEDSEAGTITAADFDVFQGDPILPEYITISQSTNPAQGQGVVIIIPRGGIYDENGEEDATANVAGYLFLYSINGVLIARNAPGDPVPDIGRSENTQIGPTAEAYYLRPDNERTEIPGEITAPILLASSAPGNFDLTITLTSFDGRTVLASDTFVIETTAARRTNGVLSGETSGSIECGGTSILSGTFQVTEGTANIYFETAGVGIGTFSSDPEYLTRTNGRFVYSVTGNGVDVSGEIFASGNSFRRNNNLGLNELAVGSYTWTIRFADCEDNFILNYGTRPPSRVELDGAMGRITAEGNVFF